MLCYPCPCSTLRWWSDNKTPAGTRNTDGSNYDNNGAGWKYPSLSEVGGFYSNETFPINRTAGQDISVYEEFNGAARTWCVPVGGIELEGRDNKNYTTPVNTNRTYGRGVQYECQPGGYQSWNEMVSGRLVRPAGHLG